MGDVVAITGTRREATVLRGFGLKAIAIGGRSGALDHLSAPIAGLISFGMAGALGPDLRIGDWVIGTQTCGEVNAQCDADWVAALARQLPRAPVGPIYADGRLISDVAEKQALFRNTGAIIADMESHSVAASATRLGVPFVVLRCVSDQAAHQLPPVVAVAMRSDGSLAVGAILSSLASNPQQLLNLPATLRAFSAGYQAMKTGAQRLTDRLAFDQR